MTRHFVCGDIHGCVNQLHAKLDELGFDKTRDKLHALGDLADRGPYSVEAQRGTKGTGKVWHMTIVRRNPNFQTGSTDWKTCREWDVVADVRPQLGKYVIPGYVKASVWWDDARDRRHGIEGYFPEEAIGVQFIVRVAPDFIS